MCQAVPIQVLHVVIGRMVIIMSVDESKEVAIYIAIFPENGRIRVVWKEFIYAIHERRRYRKFWICLFECFYEPCISLVGFQDHITWTFGSTCFKIQH